MCALLRLLFEGADAAAGKAGGAEEEEAGSGKKEEAWFPSKVSACQLYPSVYACLPKEGMGDDKSALLEAFAALSDDEVITIEANMQTHEL